MVKERGRYTRRNAWDEAYDLKVYRGGEKLDPGVNYFVLMLDQLGLETRYSCEGHPAGFYITFVAPYSEALEIEKRGFFTVEIEGKNYWSLRWYGGDGEPTRGKTDALRWAANTWEDSLGPLDLESVKLDD